MPRNKLLLSFFTVWPLDGFEIHITASSVRERKGPFVENAARRESAIFERLRHNRRRIPVTRLYCSGACWLYSALRDFESELKRRSLFIKSASWRRSSWRTALNCEPKP